MGDANPKNACPDQTLRPRTQSSPDTARNQLSGKEWAEARSPLNHKPSDTTSSQNPQTLKYHKPSKPTNPRNPQTLRYHALKIKKPSDTTSPQKLQVPRTHTPSEITSPHNPQALRNPKSSEPTSPQKSQERDGQRHQLSNSSKKEIPVLAVS